MEKNSRFPSRDQGLREHSATAGFTWMNQYVREGASIFKNQREKRWVRWEAEERCAGQVSRGPRRRKVVNRFGPRGFLSSLVYRPRRYLHLVAHCKILYDPVLFQPPSALLHSTSFTVAPRYVLLSFVIKFSNFSPKFTRLMKKKTNNNSYIVLVLRASFFFSSKMKNTNGPNGMSEQMFCKQFVLRFMHSILARCIV